MENLKTQIQKYMNIESVEKYLSMNFVVFSAISCYYDDTGKHIYPPSCYTDFTPEIIKKNLQKYYYIEKPIFYNKKFSQKDNEIKEESKNTFSYFNPNISAMEMLMGVEYQPDKHIILLDIDTKCDKEKKNGFEFINIICDNKETNDSLNNTVKEITHSGGIHYYFYITTEQINKLKSSATAITYDKQQYAVDFKIKKQLSHISPTNFMKNDGKVYGYKFEKDFFTTEIKQLPKLLWNVLYDNAKVENIIKHSIVSNKNVELNHSPIFKTTVEKDIIQNYLQFLNCYDEFEEWRDICFIVKCLNNEAFDLFDDWSKKSKKYNHNCCIRLWNSQRKYVEMNVYAFNTYLKKCNMNGYENLLGYKHDVLYTPKKINKQYLDETVLTNNKIVCIKSECSTGKTTLMKKVVEKYINKKILYIAYRRSLSNNIEQIFKQYDFKNYLDGYNTEDHQIISVDSLTNIINDYEIIIIDEIRSVLRHMTSKIMDKQKKSKNYIKDTFTFFSEMIQECEKCFCLDADFNDACFYTMNSLCNDICVIENVYKPIQYDINVIVDDIFFDNKIDEYLKNGKNIVIICQANEHAQVYYEKYKKLYKCKIYTGKSDDETKKYDLQHINTEWSKINCLIYSSTIEAGVDYNKSHFDNMFIRYSPLCNTYMGLIQMMYRIRKFSNNEVFINLKNATHQSIIDFDEIINQIKITTKKDKLDTLEMLYAYNKYEQKNSEKSFKQMFLNVLKQKGHTLNYIVEKKYKKPTKSKKLIVNAIFNAKMIDKETYKSLVDKKFLSQDEKLQIERFKICNMIDKKDVEKEEFIKWYGKTHILTNFLDICKMKCGEYVKIDGNIINCEKTQSLEIIYKFLNIFNNNQYDKETFIEKSKDAIKIYNEYIKINCIDAVIKDDFTLTKKIGHMNTMIKSYGFKIKIERKNNHNKDGKYQISFIDDVDVITKRKLIKSYVNHMMSDIFFVDEKNKYVKIYKTISNDFEKQAEKYFNF